MRKILICIASAVILSAATAQTDATNEASNEIDPKTPLRLDPYLRKALLRALTELEANYSSNDTDVDDYYDSTSTEHELLQTSDGMIQNIPPTQNSLTRDINYHSYVVDGQQAFINSSAVLPTPVKQALTAITDGNKELIETNESSNSQRARSLTENVLSQNTISGDEKRPSIDTFTPATTTTTTATTTTTTTPKPTHNDDGENIEEVQNRDVQVFQAPLVAAFTVHQDADGQPHRVVPIYKQSTRQAITPIKSNNIELVRQQLTLQQQLEEKQRLLEHQLQLLQQQQRQQEEILKRQEFFQQQQNILKSEQNRNAPPPFLQIQQSVTDDVQRQQQNILEQQLNLQRQQKHLQQQQLQQQNFQQQQFINQQFQPQSFQQQPFQQLHLQNPIVQQNQNPINAPTSTVTFQPSISIEPKNPTLEQQLPNKEAVDFLIHLRNQRPMQFPLEHNHLPQGISVQQRLPIQNNLNSFDGFRSSQLFGNEQPRNNHGNRVFRHESKTGNFGFNNNLEFTNARFTPAQEFSNQRFIAQNSVRQSQPQRFRSDAELQQLLLQSGISNGGRSQEDFNIVSKVLSLNHGINANNNFAQNSNFLFGETRRQPAFGR